jgi:hypothetical protein
MIHVLGCGRWSRCALWGLGGRCFDLDLCICCLRLTFCSHHWGWVVLSGIQEQRRWARWRGEIRLVHVSKDIDHICCHGSFKCRPIIMLNKKTKTQRTADGGNLILVLLRTAPAPPKQMTSPSLWYSFCISLYSL